MRARKRPRLSAGGRVGLPIGLLVAGVASPYLGVSAVLGALAAAAFACLAAVPLSAVLFVLGVEETSRRFGALKHAPALVTYSHAVFDTDVLNIPLAAWVVIVAGLATLSRGARPLALARRAPRKTLLTPMILGCLALLPPALKVAQDGVPLDPHSALRLLPLGTPWFLGLCAFWIIQQTLRTIGRDDQLFRMVVYVLLAKGAFTALVLLTGGWATIDGQKYVVFYDAATPALAAALLLAIGFGRAGRGLNRPAPFAVASALIVFFSFRRSVWSSLAFALPLLPFLQQRFDVAKRLLVLLAVAALVFAVAPANLRENLMGRVGSGLAVAQGRGDEGPATAHKTDLQEGVKLALQHPFRGVGVTAPQPRQFTADSTLLYVHDEYLQTWLRLGILGFGLLLALFVRLLSLAVRVIRDRGASPLETVCAYFLFMLPVLVITAPFLSTTTRWPVLVGATAAVIERSTATPARSRLATTRVDT